MRVSELMTKNPHAVQASDSVRHTAQVMANHDIGAVLVYSPAIMGVGYEYVDQALNGGLLLKTMAILCFLKLGATIVSYASGNAGGIFAPKS